MLALYESDSYSVVRVPAMSHLGPTTDDDPADRTTLQPDTQPLGLLDGSWRGQAVEELVTWRAAFDWLRDAGSDVWWQKLEASFAAKMLLFSECRKAELAATLAPVAVGDRVLDVACGPGSTSRMIAARGAVVVGIDDNPAVLDVARSGPAHPGVDFVTADARGPLPFDDGSFDVVHFADFYDLAPLPEIRRVLRPNGTLIIRATGMGGGRLLAHDLELDAAVGGAAERGIADRFGRTGHDTTSWAGQLRAAGLSAPATTAFEWHGPLPPLLAAWLVHSAALWIAGHARPHLSTELWERFVTAWDPDDREALPYRSDAHVVQTVSVSTTILDPSHR